MKILILIIALLWIGIIGFSIQSADYCAWKKEENCTRFKPFTFKLKYFEHCMKNRTDPIPSCEIDVHCVYQTNSYDFPTPYNTTHFHIEHYDLNSTFCMGELQNTTLFAPFRCYSKEVMEHVFDPCNPRYNPSISTVEGISVFWSFLF